MANIRIIEVVEEFDDTQINEWELYEQIAQCCQEIDGADECTDEGKVESWQGYPQSEDDWNPEDIYNDYKLSYGDRLIGYQVDNVGGPENGGPCGEQHTTWEGSLGCCEDPPVLFWVERPSEVVRDQTYQFSANGGVGPFTWSVVGSGLFVSGNDFTAQVRADTCFCDPGLVVCTDACGQQIIQEVSLDDDAWSSITDTYYASDYGWEQDGSGIVRQCTVQGAVIIHGFNSDRTKHSQQAYGQICYTKATEAETDETAIAAICAAAIAEDDYAASGAVSAPGDAGGYTACGSGNVWYKDVSDLPSFGSIDFHAYYQTTSGSTYEFTHECQDSPLEIDDASTGDTVADNSSVVVVWEGGDPPFSITTEGDSFFVDSGRTETETYNYTGRAITIYTGNVCGMGYVAITDSCGSSVEVGIRATDGAWERWQCSSPADDCWIAGHSHAYLSDSYTETPGTIISEEWWVEQPFDAVSLSHSDKSWVENYLDTACASALGGDRVCPGVATHSVIYNTTLGKTFTACGSNCAYESEIWQDGPQWRAYVWTAVNEVSSIDIADKMITEKWVC